MVSLSAILLLKVYKMATFGRFRQYFFPKITAKIQPTNKLLITCVSYDKGAGATLQLVDRLDSKYPCDKKKGHTSGVVLKTLTLVLPEVYN